jgi:DNA-binding protein Fis
VNDEREPVEPLRVARRNAAAEFERSYVQMVLERANGNITRAAALAAVSRQMIQKLMRKYGL